MACCCSSCTSKVLLRLGLSLCQDQGRTQPTHFLGEIFAYTPSVDRNFIMSAYMFAFREPVSQDDSQGDFLMPYSCCCSSLRTQQDLRLSDGSLAPDPQPPPPSLPPLYAAIPLTPPAGAPLAPGSLAAALPPPPDYTGLGGGVNSSGALTGPYLFGDIAVNTSELLSLVSVYTLCARLACRACR
jgi:hypothetical protein